MASVVSEVPSQASSRASRRSSASTQPLYDLTGRRNARGASARRAKKAINRAAASSFFTASQLDSLKGTSFVVDGGGDGGSGGGGGGASTLLRLTCTDDSIIIDASDESVEGSVDVKINNEYLFKALEAMLHSQTDMYDRTKWESNEKAFQVILAQLSELKTQYEDTLAQGSGDGNVDSESQKETVHKIASDAVQACQTSYFESEDFAQLIADIVKLHVDEAAQQQEQQQQEKQKLENQKQAKQKESQGGSMKQQKQQHQQQGGDDDYDMDDGNVDLPDDIIADLVGESNASPSRKEEMRRRAAGGARGQSTSSAKRSGERTVLDAMPDSLSGFGHGDMLIFESENNKDGHFTTVSLSDILQLVDPRITQLEEIVSQQQRQLSSLQMTLESIIDTNGGGGGSVNEA
jgi:hypothetical protein